MATVDINISDFDKLCRMCLGRDKQMKCLFEDEMEYIRSMIHDFIIYAISASDNFPNNICLECIDQVRATYDFKNQCERSFEMLASIVEMYETDHVILNKEGEIVKDENIAILPIKAEDTSEFIETIFNDGEFDCADCVMSFSQEIELFKHISAVHEKIEEKPPTSYESHEVSGHDSPRQEESCENKTNEEYPLKQTDDNQPKTKMVGRPRKLHKCNMCNKSFKRPSHLTLHKITHMKQKPVVPCNACGKRFTGVEYLRKHRAHCHKQERRYHVCDICNKSLISAEGLNRHKIRRHSDKKPFVCMVCNRRFPERALLTKHLVYHHSPSIMRHTCNYCNEGFKFSTELQKHHMSHVEHFNEKEEKSFVCKICNKVYSRPDLLRYHEFVHNGEQFPCPQCDMGFSRPDYLRRHIFKCHEKKASLKVYKCDICNKVLATLGNLRQHEITHLEEKQFECKICIKRFSRASHLRRHQSHVHENSEIKKDHKCDVCSKSFEYASHLRQHQLSHSTEKPFNCKICNKGFSTTVHFRRHQNVHAPKGHYPCDVCGKSFTLRVNLARHATRSHRNRRNCPGTVDSKEDLTKHKSDTIDAQSGIARDETSFIQNEQQHKLEVMENRSRITEEEIVDECLQIVIKEEDYHLT